MLLGLRQSRSPAGCGRVATPLVDAAGAFTLERGAAIDFADPAVPHASSATARLAEPWTRRDENDALLEHGAAHRSSWRDADGRSRSVADSRDGEALERLRQRLDRSTAFLDDRYPMHGRAVESLRDELPGV